MRFFLSFGEILIPKSFSRQALDSFLFVLISDNSEIKKEYKLLNTEDTQKSYLKKPYEELVSFMLSIILPLSNLRVMEKR